MENPHIDPETKARYLEAMGRVKGPGRVFTFRGEQILYTDIPTQGGTMATKTDTTKLDEAYAEVKQLEKAQIEAAFPDDPWPASEAKKQIEDHEQRLAFLEARLGMTKPIREHEFDASEHVVPESPTAPRALYRDSGVVEGMQAQADAGSDDRTKDELLEEAAKLDIKGRSSMSKDELAAAVADARGDTVPA